AGNDGGLYANNIPLNNATGRSVGSPAGDRDDDRLNAQTEERDFAQKGREIRSKDAINTPGSESYQPVYDNPFCAVTDQPLSTFGLDVDTASYSNIRRFLLNNQLPPRDAVRIEEMLNYFSYDYPAPRGREPFALYVEMGECPWNPAHQLALVGLKAKDFTGREQPPLNLVFLIDVSGSMQPANKLPLIKQALRLLVPQLTARDRVSIVVYASNSRIALSSTRGDDHRRILSVIDELSADGSTNGGEGIQHAYAQASENFIKGGVNRVILCTDGDFNVGITDQSELTRLIEDKAKSGVFLSVFGFGMGNLKDSTMQKLADKGNGQYAYLDDLDEARKVLVDQARSTIITVAKDVKLQVEFNPAQVQAYRLIGYEKRQLAARDFNNDRKDAGDLGAGHTVTALYEIVPAGEAVGEPGVDALKYQPAKNRPAVAGEWATVKLRYKNPDADKSQLLTAALKNSGLRWRTASDDFQFAAAVAAFGMVLRDSGYKGESTLDLALELAEAGRGRDVKRYRSEFAELVKRAASMSR
ncbi:MAG: VWA domain-containing protein, partial [Verrucomicrobiota bacterium]